MILMNNPLHRILSLPLPSPFQPVRQPPSAHLILTFVAYLILNKIAATFPLWAHETTCTGAHVRGGTFGSRPDESGRDSWKEAA